MIRDGTKPGIEIQTFVRLCDSSTLFSDYFELLKVKLSLLLAHEPAHGHFVHVGVFSQGRQEFQ